MKKILFVLFIALFVGCNSNDSEIEELKKELKEVRSILDESEVVYDLTGNDEESIGYGQCVEGNCENGKGKMVWGVDSSYTGGWVNKKRNGQGTLTHSDGTKYVGEYKDDKMHGQGTYTWQNPWEQYVGEFKDGNKHGQGTLTFADGEKYVGGWKDRKKHGQELILMLMEINM